jgi:integrase
VTVTKRPDGTWRARFILHGKERAKHFKRKRDAEAWVEEQRVSFRSGTWRDPRLARITVGELGEAWLDEQVAIAPSTTARYRGLWRTHVEPAWGKRRLDSITRGDVQSWIATMIAAGVGASVVRQSHRVLALILEFAIDHERIATNPARKPRNLPALPPVSRLPLTVEELHALMSAAPADVGDHVFFLAMTGVRFGEMAAVKVAAVDVTRRSIRIADNVTEVGGHLSQSKTPKGRRARLVSYPEVLDDVVARHMTGKGPGDLLFTSPKGMQLRLRNWRRYFDVAVVESGIRECTPHELRHTYASLAIAGGADVKVVQNQLGHASATLTLDTYGHLFPHARDEAARRMGTAVGPDRRARDGGGEGSGTRMGLRLVQGGRPGSAKGA